VPALADGAVQCWLDRLDDAPPWSTLPLPAHETARSAQMAAADRRAAFVRGRQLLRFVAAAQLGVAPADVPLVVADSGKPLLSGSGALDVSITHTGQWVAVALSRAGAVGLDIESTERRVDDASISRRYFAPEERTAVDAAGDAAARRAAFFRVWARKEAVVKATGDGLSGGLGAFAVPAVEGAVLPLLRPADVWMDAGPWWLYALPAPAGTVAALALRGPRVSVQCLRWA
jgi:4'-phosphopantetheinyl transferase